MQITSFNKTPPKTGFPKTSTTGIVEAPVPHMIEVTKPQLAAIQIALTTLVGMTDAEIEAKAADYGPFAGQPETWDAATIKATIARVFPDLAPGR